MQLLTGGGRRAPSRPLQRAALCAWDPVCATVLVTGQVAKDGDAGTGSATLFPGSLGSASVVSAVSELAPPCSISAGAGVKTGVRVGWRGELMSGCGWKLGLLSRLGIPPHTLSQERPPCRAGEDVSGAASAGKGLQISFVAPELSLPTCVLVPPASWDQPWLWAYRLWFADPSARLMDFV